MELTEGKILGNYIYKIKKLRPMSTVLAENEIGVYSGIERDGVYEGFHCFKAVNNVCPRRMYINPEDIIMIDRFSVITRDFIGIGDSLD